MAYFKKTDSLTGKPKKEKRASFSSFPKRESPEDTPSKKKKPFGKSGTFYEKKKRKPIGEDELPASRGFYKSKTGYNNPAAPWNREKKSEAKKAYGSDSPKTFQPKGILRDPTRETEHENNPANYGPSKLQFRRISKRSARSFSKNKERAYEEQKALKLATINPKVPTKPYEKTEQVEEKKKFMHGKGKPVKKGESKGTFTERTEKPRKKINPKPFKATMPNNWRKVEE